MEKLIFVSADGHAVMNPDRWRDYLEPARHKYLDRLQRESQLFSKSMKLIAEVMLPAEVRPTFDKDGRYAAGQWRGVWDREVRLEEMDREGVAAEFVFPGDFRAAEMFHHIMNGTYPVDAVDAGVRAWNRWAHDTFGPAKERFLLISPAGSFANLDDLIAEATWLADHGFAGMYTPGFAGFAGQPPLYDRYWDPFWALCAERGLVMITHGGYGAQPGLAFCEIEAAADRVAAKGGDDKDFLAELTQVFNREFFSDLRCQRSMWQMMLGGVFDRHPGLKVMLTEARADWIPTALRIIDRIWAENRHRLPARRRPSEYWGENFMAGVSFMRKCEVELRQEVGVERLSFGRDYPHTEGTWPNTTDYLKVLFRGVSEPDVRAILGENIIRFLGLDRARLKAIADRIGPTYEAIAGPGPAVDPALIAHLNKRCGLNEPGQGESRAEEMAALVRSDLGRIGAPA